MPQPRTRKKASVVEAAPVEPVAEPPKKAVRGFIPAAQWVRKTAGDWLQVEDGAEPLWIECNVSGVLHQDIIWLITSDGTKTWADIWGYLAPRIRAWNLMYFDHAANDWTFAPPPSEIGAASLGMVGTTNASFCRTIFVSAIQEGPDDRQSFLAQ